MERGFAVTVPVDRDGQPPQEGFYRLLRDADLIGDFDAAGAGDAA